MIIITKTVMKRSRKRMRMRRMVMVTMIKVYHLPKAPVRYPSDCNSFGQVVALGGRPTYNTVFKNDLKSSQTSQKVTIDLLIFF